jgi:hypothetical protein
MKCGGQLAKTVVKTEWQNRKYSIAGLVAEIPSYALAANEHILVREYDPFRLAGAAGRVKYRSHIGGDHPI